MFMKIEKSSPEDTLRSLYRRRETLNQKCGELNESLENVKFHLDLVRQEINSTERQVLDNVVQSISEEAE